MIMTKYIRKKVSSYWQPTPVVFRRLGDALLSVSALITAAAIADGTTWLAYTSLAIGVIGKFLTNFFKVN